MGRWTLLPVVLLVAVLGTGCTNDASVDDAGTEERETETTATESGAGDASSGQLTANEASVVGLPVLDDASPYVRGLCSIDLFDPDQQDPVGWVIAELRALPTTSLDEASEVEWMVERLERADDLDDPLATDDLTAVAAALRARCP
jgi:hypothetical protein